MEMTRDPDLLVSKRVVIDTSIDTEKKEKLAKKLNASVVVAYTFAF